MKKIVLIGAGGHCKVIIDIIKSTNEFEIIGVTEKKFSEDKILDIPIIGDDCILERLYSSGVRYAFVCVGGLGNLQLRNKIYMKLKKIGFKIPKLIHKNAIVSKYVDIEEGTCIMAGAVVNPGVHIGKNCIINTSAVVEHDCSIGDNSHIAPRAVLSGATKIGRNTHIGLGSSIIQCVNIGKNVTIGAGAIVINNIEDNTLAVGVPARVIRVKDNM
ncbi:acetyltransferase [Crassaminicella profunda]|uniref:acetyltransferase n=1 Tax=Crassaminicella profunda TaxID=1286698 RepID=UPI001CA743D0|nr:acetyltransferase [Crassaminicella profunda]QZY54306.1 acetyltransferase [Crassaminicella profunda]